MNILNLNHIPSNQQTLTQHIPLNALLDVISDGSFSLEIREYLGITNILAFLKQTSACLHTSNDGVRCIITLNVLFFLLVFILFQSLAQKNPPMELSAEIENIYSTGFLMLVVAILPVIYLHNFINVYFINQNPNASFALVLTL